MPFMIVLHIFKLYRIVQLQFLKGIGYLRIRQYVEKFDGLFVSKKAFFKF